MNLPPLKINNKKQYQVKGCLMALISIISILAAIIFIIVKPWKETNLTNRDIAFIFFIYLGMFIVDILWQKKIPNQTHQSTTKWYETHFFKQIVAFILATTIIFTAILITAAIEKRDHPTKYGRETSAFSVAFKQEPIVHLDMPENLKELTCINYQVETPNSKYDQVVIELRISGVGSGWEKKEYIVLTDLGRYRTYDGSYNLIGNLTLEQIADIGTVSLYLYEYK